MRMSNKAEGEREDIENAVACLVGARKRLEMAHLRVLQANEIKPGLLDPALDELMEVVWKVSKSQIYLTNYLVQKNAPAATGAQTTNNLQS